MVARPWVAARNDSTFNFERFGSTSPKTFAQVSAVLSSSLVAVFLVTRMNAPRKLVYLFSMLVVLSRCGLQFLLDLFNLVEVVGIVMFIL